MSNASLPLRAKHSQEYKSAYDLVEGMSTEADFLAGVRYAVGAPADLHKLEMGLQLAGDPRFVHESRRLLLEGTDEPGIWMLFATRPDLSLEEFQLLITHPSRYVVANALLNDHVPPARILEVINDLGLPAFPSNLRERIWGHILGLDVALPEEVVYAAVDEGLGYEFYVDAIGTHTDSFTDDVVASLVYPERHGRSATKYQMQIALLWSGRLNATDAYALWQSMSAVEVVGSPVFAEMEHAKTITWAALGGCSMPFSWVIPHVLSDRHEVEKNVARRPTEFQDWLREEGHLNLLDLPWEWVEPFFQRQFKP